MIKSKTFHKMHQTIQLLDSDSFQTVYSLILNDLNIYLTLLAKAILHVVF